MCSCMITLKISREILTQEMHQELLLRLLQELQTCHLRRGGGNSGATHYTQKKRRTVPLTMPRQGQLVFFGQISIVKHHFPSTFFQTMFSTNRPLFYFREWDAVATAERKRVEEERSRMALIQESGSKYVPKTYMCEILKKKQKKLTHPLILLAL